MNLHDWIIEIKMYAIYSIKILSSLISAGAKLSADDCGLWALRYTSGLGLHIWRLINICMRLILLVII